MADSVMDSIIEKSNTKAAEPKKSQPSDEDNRRNNDCRVPVPGRHRRLWSSQEDLRPPTRRGKAKRHEEEPAL